MTEESNEDQADQTEGQNAALAEAAKTMNDRADETARRIYVAQFMDLAVTFLLREYMAAGQENVKKVEDLIQSWRDGIGQIIGETIQNHEEGLDKVLGKAGLTTNSEMHERADTLMFEAESVIRHTINLPKPDLGN